MRQARDAAQAATLEQYVEVQDTKAATDAWADARPNGDDAGWRRALHDMDRVTGEILERTNRAARMARAE